MIVPYSILGALPTLEKIVAAGTLCGYSRIFLGLVFSGSFRDYRQPARGLGINLLERVVGGVLENLVMVGGTPILECSRSPYNGASVVAIGISSCTKTEPREYSTDTE
jgi:hypothetical protein